MTTVANTEIKTTEIKKIVLFMRRSGVKSFSFGELQVEFDSSTIINEAMRAEYREQAKRRSSMTDPTMAHSDSTVARLDDEVMVDEELVYHSSVGGL